MTQLSLCGQETVTLRGSVGVWHVKLKRGWVPCHRLSYDGLMRLVYPCCGAVLMYSGFGAVGHEGW